MLTKTQIAWEGKIPPLRADTDSTLFFLPIQGKLFGKPVPYAFSQDFLVTDKHLFCSWGGRGQIESLLQRRGHKYPPVRVFTVFVCIGFGAANLLSSDGGKPWLEPALIFFQQSPVSGEKDASHWLEVVAKSDGFQLTRIREHPLEFLPAPEGQHMLSRLKLISSTFPDFSTVLPYPRRAQVLALYGLDEHKLPLPPALLPYQD